MATISRTEILKGNVAAFARLDAVEAADSPSFVGVTCTGPTAGLGYATGAGGAITQITSAATPVTLNKVCGKITTVALTTAAAAEEEFVVNNTNVVATDVIALSTTYAGAGTPVLSVKTVGAGVFTVVITNVHASNALNAVMVINFAVIKSVIA